MKFNADKMGKQETKHQRTIVNNGTAKTTRQRGYGFGVTFSSRCFSWERNFSYAASDLGFSELTPF